MVDVERVAKGKGLAMPEVGFQGSAESAELQVSYSVPAGEPDEVKEILDDMVQSMAHLMRLATMDEKMAKILREKLRFDVLTITRGLETGRKYTLLRLAHESDEPAEEVPAWELFPEGLFAPQEKP